LPRDTTAGELFWAILFNESVRGYYPSWEFGFMLRILLMLLVLLVVVWITCGWVGRWLGLRMKHPGFAPALTLTLIFVPPFLGFSFLCYVADEINLDQMPEQRFLPMMAWVAFGVGVAHCLFLCRWAAGRLRKEFRNTVTSRFQPPTARRWWRPTWRGIRTLTIRTAAAGAAVVVIVLGYYGYQNWRSRAAWQSFESELKQRGETLDVAALLPGPVPDEKNFVRSAAFQGLVGGGSGLAQSLLDRPDLNQTFERYTSFRNTLEWTAQQSLPLHMYVDWVWLGGNVARTSTNNAEVVTGLLQQLQAHQAVLNELAVAARLPACQIITNRDPIAVLRTSTRESRLLEHLQFLFLLRANARLVARDNAGAGEDLLTGLQLTQLARQLPDARATLRVQVLLARACQPLWEGCVGHDWTEPQLMAFQQQLERFDLLGDYTNAVQRIVRAYIGHWRPFAETGAMPRALADDGSGYVSYANRRWEPRGCWYDRCLQLHRAGERALGRVEAEGERVRADYDWQTLRGLNLSWEAEQVIEPYPYVNNNLPNPTLMTFAKTALGEALLACSLERYWLAHGQYPEALAALVPAYLERIPRDPISGRDLIYQRQENGGFLLRGVGPNGRDDRSSKGADDWLWAFPTNQTSRVSAPVK
jgi:hypothetical protein